MTVNVKCLFLVRLDDVIVLGMVTQLKYGSYYLEDPSGVVKLGKTYKKN